MGATPTKQPMDATSLPLVQSYSRGDGKVANPGALTESSTLTLDGHSDGCMICFDRDDNLVLPRYSDNEVHVVDKRGKLVRKVGTSADHNGPYACVVDKSGRVFVVEKRERRNRCGPCGCVKVFGATSVELVIETEGLQDPECLALSHDETELYVTGRRDCAVSSYHAGTGTLVDSVSKSCYLTGPCGVAAIHGGGVVVTSQSATNGGAHVFYEGASPKWLDGCGWSYPLQVAADSNNIFFAVNAYGNNVVAFTHMGAVKGRYPNTGDLLLHAPTSIAIDSHGTVAVMDNGGKRVLFLKSQ